VTMDFLVLRFDAPLMSFGAPVVDRHGVIQPYPALSMIAGMIANALGNDHADFARIDRLQKRLRYASREDRRGKQIRDYQTVDLGQSFMRDDRAWTTTGALQRRAGGAAATGTHIRLRDYWAGAIHTVVITLEPPDESPTLDEVADALQYPERPLFIGRKTCLPGAPIYAGRMQAEDLLDALRRASLADEADQGPGYRAWWPSKSDDARPADMRQPVIDARDWENQIHVGERWIAEGILSLSGEAGDAADG